MFDVFGEKKISYLHSRPVDLNIYFRTFLFRSIPRGFYVQNKGLMKWPNRPVVICTASMWNQSDRKTNTVLSTYRNYFGHFTSPILFGSKNPTQFYVQTYLLCSFLVDNGANTCTCIYYRQILRTWKINYLSQTLTFNKLDIFFLKKTAYCTGLYIFYPQIFFTFIILLKYYYINCIKSYYF